MRSERARERWRGDRPGRRCRIMLRWRWACWMRLTRLGPVEAEIEP